MIVYSPPEQIAITFYQWPNGTGHVHNTYLTWAEASDLMLGVVASVVKNSSGTSSGAAHVHSTTITWDAVNYKFNAVAAIALGHIHSVTGNSPSEGWEVLNKTQLTVAANATSILNIPARDLLRITCIVTGYSGGGIASLRFGTTLSAVDSGNNYQTLHADGVNGSSKWDNYTNSNSTNFLRLARANAVLGRMVQVNVSNFATVRKLCQISTATEAGAANVSPNIATGQGIYANTTAQIIAVQMISTANNLNIGSGFIVEGMNLV